MRKLTNRYLLIAAALFLVVSGYAVPAQNITSPQGAPACQSALKYCRSNDTSRRLIAGEERWSAWTPTPATVNKKRQVCMQAALAGGLLMQHCFHDLICAGGLPGRHRH